MTYFSGFTSHQPCHTNFKRIHHNSLEMKPCCVENDTKTASRGFLFPVSVGLTLVFTQLFSSKLLPRSLKLGYTTLLSIIMTLRFCGTTTNSLDRARITFLTILALLLTENGIFHHFSMVNKLFWCPN